MVNSLQRLFAEIIETLDRAGQQVGNPYVRSQVFAVIDILTNMASRVEWKRADLQANIDDLRAVFSEIARLLGANGSCPPDLAELREQLVTAATEAVGDDLVAERDRLSRLLITAMEQISAARAQLSQAVADAIDRQCNGYLRRQLERDLALARRPLFRRMSQA
jgi:hypothetical protein